MKRYRGVLSLAACAAIVTIVAACSEGAAPVRVLAPSQADPTFIKVPSDSTPEAEFVKVCKIYDVANGPAPSNAQFTVAVVDSTTGAETASGSIASGECFKVWTGGGKYDSVNVAEVPVSGYSTKWHRKTIVGGTVTTTSDVSGIEGTGWVGGSPAGRGEVFIFTNTQDGAGASVSKTAAGAYDNTFAWTIQKEVDKTTVSLPGGTATFNYTVTVGHDAGTASNVTVSGTITVNNPNAGAMQISGVTDALSNGTPCTVTGGGSQAIPAGNTQLAYSCNISALPAGSLDNTATVTWDDQTIDGRHVAAGSADFTFTAVSFTGNTIDECAAVTDTYAGSLGTVCVGDTNPTTFNYSRTVPVPASGCVQYDNTATFTTNDTGATGSDSKSVQVCKTVTTTGCTYTQGYWKTHSSKGPAPYDQKWLNLGPLGEGTLFFNSAKTWYTVFNTSPKKGNANYILAHQYMAAKLNILAGASTTSAVDAAMAGAAAYFPGITNLDVLPVDPTRTQLIGWASTLDNYNNGLIGPGHCN